MAWGSKSRQERGYDAAWERIRKVVLARDFGLCQCKQCQDSSSPLIATHVDHVIPKAKAKRMGWTRAQMDHPSNLQSLHPDCHARKTAEDEGRTLRVKVQVGDDGWPIG